MKYIKTFEEFILENYNEEILEDKAKDVEDKEMEMGEPKDDEKELADKMAKSKKSPTTPEEDDMSRDSENASKSKEAELEKEMEDSSEEPQEAEKEEVEENEE